MTIDQNKYKLKRYDLSEDGSLRPWGAADEFLLQVFHELEEKPKNLSLYHDRFGYLGCHLNEFTPALVSTNRSQEKAIESNFKENNITVPTFSDLLTPLEDQADMVLLKVPKSLDLFQLFLEHIVRNSTDDIVVICGFMTRHFSPNMLKLAEKYFEVTVQSKAQKKARLLTLTKKKPLLEQKPIISISYNEQVYQQYMGVFSADHIDYATQFLLDNIDIAASNQKVLDLGSGNGIIGKEISKKSPTAEIHLLDDFNLAVESAKLNIKGDNIYHHYDDNLSIFEANTFDLIVSNPPFHFEYEINIQIPLALFKESHRCLKKGGNLQIVANDHLNYKVHLAPLFSSIEIVAKNEKFIIYKCVK
ncbi:MAG: methyltransferase [Reichenbachiella sp.]